MKQTEKIKTDNEPKAFPNYMEGLKKLDKSSEDFRDQIGNDIKMFDKDLLNDANGLKNIAVDATATMVYPGSDEILDKIYCSAIGSGTVEDSTTVYLSNDVKSTSRAIIADESTDDATQMDYVMMRLISQISADSGIIMCDGSITSNIIEPSYRIINSKNDEYPLNEEGIETFGEIENKLSTEKVISVAKDYKSDLFKKTFQDHKDVLNLKHKRIGEKILRPNEYITEPNSKLQRLPFIDKNTLPLDPGAIRSADSYNRMLKRAKSNLKTIIAKPGDNSSSIKFEFFGDVFDDYEKKYELIKTLSFELKGSLTKEPTALRDADRLARYEAQKEINEYKKQNE